MELLHMKNDVSVTPNVEIQWTTAGESYYIGEALRLVSGRVTKCTNKAAQSFICLVKIDAGPADMPVLCIRINKKTNY